MKFELQPDNRNTSDEELLADLRGAAQKVATDYLSREQYDSLGRFHPQTLAKRFGTWNQALALAGLRVQKPQRLTHDDAIADIRTVAQLLGKSTLTVAEYTQCGSFSQHPITRLFGTWAKALEAAGLEVSPHYHAPLSDEELHQNLESVWRILGRQPKQSDFRQPLSRIGHDTYTRRFGSWRGALEAFVAFVNVAPPESEMSALVAVVSNATADSAAIVVRQARTGRNVSWRLRFLVMRRDSFRCCQCGACPSLIPGTVLVVDHIYPWSRGGETVFDNLRTLCVVCNGGKSDLFLDDAARAS
jgi:Homing endonuclease associated repeat/HNH endonuclease